MKVHLFGATSSPSCAAFSLRQTALDFGHGYEPLVASTVEGAAYVDDVLASVSDVEAELPKSVKRTRSIPTCTRQLSESHCTAANGVRGPKHFIGGGAVCNCVRGIVYECPRGVVYECQRRCDHVRLIYDVGALAPKIVTRCGASPSVLLSHLHFVCVIETPRVLKQGVHKLHC